MAAKAVIETSNILRGRRVTLSGKPSADAKRYQEREVKQAIEESQS